MAALKKMQRIKIQLKVAKKKSKDEMKHTSSHRRYIAGERAHSQVSSIENSNIPHVLREREREREKVLKTGSLP